MSKQNTSLRRAMAAVTALDDNALARFATWFAAFHSAAWDAQIVRDCADPATLRLLLGELADDPAFAVDGALPEA